MIRVTEVEVVHPLLVDVDVGARQVCEAAELLMERAAQHSAASGNVDSSRRV